jgi:endonuclease YncB( thermonuclease family)
MAYKKKIKKIWDFFVIPLRIIDGDTLEVFMDKGGKEWHVVKLRLALINAPEMSTVEGHMSFLHLNELLKDWIGTGDILNDKQMYVISQKYEDNYSRYISMLYFDINDRDETITEKGVTGGKSINARMVLDGYSKYQRY